MPFTMRFIIQNNQTKTPSTSGTPAVPPPPVVITKDDESRERRHTGGNQSADKPPLPPSPDRHGPPPTTPPPPVTGDTPPPPPIPPVVSGTTPLNKPPIQPLTASKGKKVFGSTYFILAQNFNFGFEITKVTIGILINKRLQLRHLQRTHIVPISLSYSRKKILHTKE